MQAEKRNIPVLDWTLFVHSHGMSEEVSRRREAFRAWMKAKGLTMAAISRDADIPESTIRSYLSGKAASLKGTTQEKIGRAYSATSEQMFGDAPPSVEVMGRIGARADVFPVDGSAPMYEIDLPPTLNPGDEYVAFEIDGFSMPPAVPGWLVVFRKRQIPLDDLAGSPCMVDLSDGRRLFKIIRRGYESGLWNLESWDGSPLIENVQINGALPFAALVPGKSARK